MEKGGVAQAMRSPFQPLPLVSGIWFPLLGVMNPREDPRVGRGRRCCLLPAWCLGPADFGAEEDFVSCS